MRKQGFVRRKGRVLQVLSWCYDKVVLGGICHFGDEKLPEDRAKRVSTRLRCYEE